MQIILEQSPWHAYEHTLQTLSELVNGHFQVFPHWMPNHIEFFALPPSQICAETIKTFPCVKQVHPLKTTYPLLERIDETTSYQFEYQGLTFSQNNFHLFAGLNAVDCKENTESVMKHIQSLNLTCTRMGAFKPRTSPYSFQGVGENSLAHIFELAGKYGIKVIAMEVTHDRQIESIYQILENLGWPTGVLLQVGTRNAQNYELLKELGQQKTFPILYKRGFGISLTESLSAAEYIAASGNRNIIFCLRGMKSFSHEDHRNFADIGQIPVLKRFTRMPVGYDPSHSVGHRLKDNHQIMDIHHIAAQAVISGANMLLLDIHPTPEQALVDAKQALNFKQLAELVEDVSVCQAAWQKRLSIYTNKKH